jgi:hypothetical protein
MSHLLSLLRVEKQKAYLTTCQDADDYLSVLFFRAGISLTIWRLIQVFHVGISWNILFSGNAPAIRMILTYQVESRYFLTSFLLNQLQFLESRFLT